MVLWLLLLLFLLLLCTLSWYNGACVFSLEWIPGHVSFSCCAVSLTKKLTEIESSNQLTFEEAQAASQERGDEELRERCSVHVFGQHVVSLGSHGLILADWSG